MTEEQSRLASMAVCDCVRDALREHLNMEADALRQLAENAAKAIVGGLSCLSAVPPAALEWSGARLIHERALLVATGVKDPTQTLARRAGVSDVTIRSRIRQAKAALAVTDVAPAAPVRYPA